MKRLALGIVAVLILLSCGVHAADRADVQVTSFSLDGEIDGENIVFSLSLEADVRKRGVILPLVSGDVAFLEGDFPKNSELLRDGDTYSVKLNSKRKAPLVFKFASRPLHEGEWRRTRFGIPAAGIRKLSVLCDRDDLEIVFPGALSVEREKVQGAQMLATAFLGVVGQFEIGWKPEVKKLDSDLVVTCDANTIAIASVGALRLDTVLTYRVIQGRLGTISLKLPEGNVTQVHGQNIQDWHIDRTNPKQPRLKVDLSRPADGLYRLSVESELVVPEFPCDFVLPVFDPENVIRSSGFVMIGTDSAIKLQISKAAGVTQVDQEVFPTVAAAQGEARTRPARVLYAYQYANTPYAIDLTADDIVTAMTADDRIVLKLAENELVVTASFEIDVKDAPAREFVIEATKAAGWTVTDVSGRNVAEADVDIEELQDKRTLRIPFTQAVAGTTLVNVRMERPLDKDAVSFDVPDFQVIGAKSERGYVVLAAEQGIRLKTGTSQGTREVHTGSAPMRVPGAQLAYRFRDPGWDLAVQIERATPAIHCEVFHLSSVGEGVAYHSVALTYHVGGAPVQEFHIAVPEEIQSIEVTGADIEGWTRKEGVCTVRLQDRVLGDYTLLLTYDRQFADDGADIEIGRITTLESESEVGYMAVASSLSLDVSEAAALPSSVIQIDRGELPQAYAAPVTDPILRAYKIMRIPHPITIRLAPYDTEQLLGQVADYVKLSTRLSKDGEAVTIANYYIKNASRQYLVVGLPEGADLWSIRQVNEGAPKTDLLSQESSQGLLIPVTRPLDPNTPIEVEVTYAEKQRPLGFWRTGFRPLRFAAPLLPDTHSTFASWAVTVPDEFAVGKSGGNMQSKSGYMTGLLSLFKKGGRLCLAFLDGPGGRRMWNVLRADRHGGQTVEFKKTVSLAGTTGPLLKLWIVPSWMGQSGSVMFFFVTVVVGLLASIAGLVRRKSVWLQAVGLTLLVVGSAESATGRTALVCMIFLGCAYTAVRIFIALARRGRRSHEARRARRAAAHAAARVTTPPPLRAVADSRDLTPFEPDTASADFDDGYTTPGLLLVLCGLLSFASILPAISEEQAPPVVPPFVMDSVALTVEGPELTPEVEQSAHVTAVLQFETDREASVLVVPAGAVLLDIDSGSDNIEIVSDRDGYWLNVLRKGDYTVTIRYQARVVEKQGLWSVHLLTPDAMKNSAILTLPGKDLEVTSEQAVLLRSSEEGEVTTTQAVFGPSRAVTLNWQPRVRKTQLEKVLFFCEENTLASLQSGVIDFVNVVRYQVAQGELREMMILIPESMSVTSVQAQDLATWSFDPQTRRLEIVLEKPVSGDFELKVMTQIARDGLPYDATFGVPLIPGAARQRGALSIGAPDSIQLRMGETKALSPMNIEDFPPQVIKLAETIGSARRNSMTVRRAYRYHSPDGVSAEVSTEQVLPEIRVVETGTLSIADERIVLATKMVLSIARSGLFFVELSLPADYEVESLTGPDVSHWDENRSDTNAVTSVTERSVLVHFNRRVTDSTDLNLVVARMEKGIEEHIVVPRIKVLDAKKHSGRFTVSGERGVRMMVAERSGVDIKKASEEGIHQAGVLVFDILRPSWSLTLKTEVMAPQIKPEVLQWVDLTEGMLQCRVYLRYEIENAGVNTFRVQVPYPDVALTMAGRNVARVHAVDKQKGIWEVNLHSKVEDLYSMRASYQIPYNTDEKKVHLRPLTTLGTEGQRGYLVVTCGGRVQVTPHSIPPGLKQENARSVPAAFGAGDLSSAVLCYRTLRPEYDLELSVIRHDSAMVLPASIDRVRMTSIVSPNRRLLTKVDLSMTVGDLRFLQLTLPNPEDELWTVLVNNKETAASRDGDIFRIPLDKETGADTSVELIYAGSSSSGRLTARQKYLAPRFLGLPLNDIEWTFFVSPGLRYYSLGGTLTYQEQERASELRMYDTKQYRLWNQMQRETSLRRARSVLDMGNKLVQTGKKKEAQRAFQQALNYSTAQADLNEDARVQLRNLVKQQVKIGLVNRRDTIRFSQNIVDEQQLGQMEQFNDGEYTAEYVSDVEQRLSAKDNIALDIVADKMIDQQAAAAGVVTAIRITMPEDGEPLQFARALQIDPAGELSVTFKVGTGWAARRIGTLIATILLFAGCWALLARRRRNAAA